MLMKKLRLAVGAMMVAVVLGAVGFACRPGDEARAQTDPSRSRAKDADPSAPAAGRAPADVEALRREVEDLRATVRILLKENRTLEKELEDLRARQGGPQKKPEGALDPKDRPKTGNELQRFDNKPAQPKDSVGETDSRNNKPIETTGQVEERQADLIAAAHEAKLALKQLQEARNSEAEQRAALELEKAMRKVRQHLNPDAPARNVN